MNRYQLLIIALSLGISIASCTSNKNTRQEPQKPNIIYILADDLGYGDLSCYGQEKFQTPNIDEMAQEGIRFTQHYAGSTVCAPSRSSLMTGLTTGHTPVRGNKEIHPEGQYPLPDASVTVAELLRNNGYVTGCFGKWGLGFPGSEGEPNNQGFDEFYGYNCQRKAHNYYPSHLWHNQEKVMLEGNVDDKFETYAAGLIHEQALQFIEKNKDSSFFLFYPNVIPHAELLIPEEYLKEFRGKLLPEKSFKGAEPGSNNFRDGGYGTQQESHAAFAAMVTLLDKQVGELLDKLKSMGLAENTIVLFSSDNGPHQEGGADPNYFDSNGSLKGFKRDLYEGGIRVPMIAWWPGKIAAGATTDHISAFWDVLPTFTDVAGIETPSDIDGISFLPVLLNQPGQKQHEYLYWEFHERGGRLAVRKDNWKLIHYQVFDSTKTSTELYDLSTDLGEDNNVAEEHPEVVKELQKIMDNARIPSDVFTFNQQ